MTRLIDADAVLKEIDGDYSADEIRNIVSNTPTVQSEAPLTDIKYKAVMHCLNKISEFCPIDTEVNQLDESPENMIRLSFAEIGDTARSAIATLIEIKPDVQREGWVSVEDRLPEHLENILCLQTSSYCEPDYLIGYIGSNGKWSAMTDNLTAENFDGGALIKLEKYFEVHYWMQLPAAPTDTE